MWINTNLFLWEEVTLIITTKDKETIEELGLSFMELKVTGYLELSENPEEYSFPDIEVKSISISMPTFHNSPKLDNIKKIEIENFSTTLIIPTNNFDKTIENYELCELPTMDSSHILLSNNRLKIKYERKCVS